jgi:hypothetical protein
MGAQAIKNGLFLRPGRSHKFEKLLEIFSCQDVRETVDKPGQTASLPERLGEIAGVHLAWTGKKGVCPQA